jgi:hypothetical protein
VGRVFLHFDLPDISVHGEVGWLYFFVQQKGKKSSLNGARRPKSTRVSELERISKIDPSWEFSFTTNLYDERPRKLVFQRANRDRSFEIPR